MFCSRVAWIVLAAALGSASWAAKRAKPPAAPPEPVVASMTGPDSPFYNQKIPGWPDAVTSHLAAMHLFLQITAHNTEANQQAILTALGHMWLPARGLPTYQNVYENLVSLLMDMRPLSAKLADQQFDLFMKILGRSGIEALSSVPLTTLSEHLQLHPMQHFWLERAPETMRSSSLYRTRSKNRIQYELLLLTILGHCPATTPGIRAAKESYFQDLEARIQSEKWDPALFTACLRFARQMNTLHCDNALKSNG